MRQIGRGLRRLGPQARPDRHQPPAPRPEDGRDRRRGAGHGRSARRLPTPSAADRDAASIRDWLAGRPEDRADDRRPQPEPHRPGRPARHRRAQLRPLCELRQGGIAALGARRTGASQLDWLATPRLDRGGWSDSRRGRGRASTRDRHHRAGVTERSPAARPHEPGSAADRARRGELAGHVLELDLRADHRLAGPGGGTRR